MVESKDQYVRTERWIAFAGRWVFINFGDMEPGDIVRFRNHDGSFCEDDKIWDVKSQPYEYQGEMNVQVEERRTELPRLAL